MPTPATHIVLGLGNTLHSDDGIGPHAIEKLRNDSRVPEDVTLIEGEIGRAHV
jgi:hydrogenase maturation protease